MEPPEKKSAGHALLLPYPSQGHINPMLQFAKRITSRGRQATAAITRFIASTTTPNAGEVVLETISDGFDDNGFAAAPSIPAYLASLESAGSETLGELLQSLARRGRPVSVVVYDSFLPWAVEVARRHGVAAAAFFTQSAAVNLIYCHVWDGRLDYPAVGEVEELPGLPRMEPDELPSFLSVPAGPYAAYFELLRNQYNNLEKADFILINSFYELEPKEVDWLTSTRAASRTIGPTIPSTYVDDRVAGDSTYGIQLYPPESDICRSWTLDLRPASAVFVSFGSMAELSVDQTVHLAFGLAAAGVPFLWVVRSSETHKLPSGFIADAKKSGSLIVSWAPQLEALASGKFGCFVTHCGWNSTLEALALGVPMVGLPQWTDQPTNAKYIEEVWGVGLRARKGEAGFVTRDEVERCVSTVMKTRHGNEIQRRSAEWQEATRRALSAGGSSDRNLDEFLKKLC